MKENQLSLKRTLYGGKLYPLVSSVGTFVTFDFGMFGSTNAKIVKVVGDYVTYEFPKYFNLTQIKEQLYEAKKESISIQSIQSPQERNFV